MSCHPAVLQVKTENDSFPIFIEPGAEKFGAGDGYASADRIGGSGIENRLEGGLGLDSSAELDLQGGCGDNLLQNCQILRLRCLGSVKVHKMQPRRPCLPESQSHLDRIGRVNLASGVISLGEADTLSVNQVDCWYYVEFRHIS